MIIERELYVAVGERIRKTRKLRSMTQDQLAKRVGLERSSIANIELGNQRLPLHTLFSIASVLNIDANDLLPETPRGVAPVKTVKMGISGVDYDVPESVANAVATLNLADTQ
ncbi:helix-turn-helix transcriptional regulator [Solimonas sp. SE-A11]|uniref:helix-turn-helix transcriptional regulator n=1 Tax=Solimonas sp. SE-A11 TaxID=3054954 RepID=UPI00259CDC4E|nr:helix-turn-helix transcriptional regulator [Solimonas sp. SE-A11]MDM4772863.1 helix-turn-helix transcriptional regulator [Solimonas sp. SE-A11]